MQSNKKVLFITYYWPPAGGIGVLRCLKIVKYIREFGWEPVVYTAKDAHYPVFDYGNLSLVPEGVKVISQPIIEPFAFYKFITGRKKDDTLVNVLNANEKRLGLMHELSIWGRSNFFIPDARSLWIKPSVKYLLKYLKVNPVDAIFTDGPPHTNTMIASYIKEKTGIPWLADFQDPWTQVDYYQLLKLTKWADRKHREMEQKAFRNADKMTIVSPTWKKDLEEIGAKNVSIIPWGFDPEDFNEEAPLLDEKFTITHLGLMGNDRNPDLMFKVLSDLCKDVKGFAEDLQVKLIGSVDFSVRESVNKYGLTSKVVISGQIPRKESITIMRQSQVVLLLLNIAHNVQGRIPGKLFEYIGAGRPILCIGPDGTDVDGIINEVNAGISVPYEDYSRIKDAILNFYNNYKKGTLSTNLSPSVEKYSIRNLSGEIAGFLNQIAAKKNND